MSASWEIRQGDALEQLRAMPEESVHCCVTSPPYYGLRDYGLPPSVWGGDVDCVHEWGALERGKRQDVEPADETTSTARLGTDERQGGAGLNGGRFCVHCSAWLGCIGLEPSLDLYVEHLVELFGEVRRVLRSDGTLWLNLGDSYAAKPRGSDEGWDKSRLSNPGRLQKAQAASLRRSRTTSAADVKDEPWTPGGGRHLRDVLHVDDDEWAAFTRWREWCAAQEDLTDVWILSSAPFPEAHFATFPPKLIRPAILAGTSEHGVCADCGAPYRRTVEVDGPTSRDRVNERGLVAGARQPDGTAEHSLNHRGKHRTGERTRRTTGWVAGCDCAAGLVPATVIDIFSGAGTTGLESLRHGRSYIGLELNPDYAEMSRRRIRDDAPLMNTASEVAA